MIDITKISRDYSKYPLKIMNKGCCKIVEKPKYKDIKYLYIDCNLEKQEIANYFSVSSHFISDILKYYNIKKRSKEKTLEELNISLDELYDMYVEKNICGKDLAKKLNITYTNFNKILKKNNIKKPQLKRIENQIRTNIKKYGCKYPLQNDNIISKVIKTNIKRYGIETVLLLKKYKNKANSKEAHIKSYNTMRKNGTLGKSSSIIENKIFNDLKEKYPDVIRQYMSNNYPWKCDFYIPSLELYIEYQGSWTHGPTQYHCHEPFDIKNKKHINCLNIMNNKNTDYYRKAIKIWSEIDPLKRETAKKNNLNWLEFFTYDDFKKWISNV